MACFWSATRGGSRTEVPLNLQNHLRVYSQSSLSSPSTIIQGYGSPTQEQIPPPNKKRKQAGNPGFQRDQNLQLHRRSHNLPWNLKVRSRSEVITKKVYVCPVPTCIHHNPARALGNLTGIKKHFLRKHGAKTWECDKCSKMYAVQSDCNAHFKTCTRDFDCKCGSLVCRLTQDMDRPSDGDGPQDRDGPPPGDGIVDGDDPPVWDGPPSDYRELSHHEGTDPDTGA
ncbi:hypothetical protein Dsin_022410 [Dipteronia sinensis]|uniref:C2H2-type domain-containing protein n=1 Tax=Dipteronia sinensis TaxID=43782 RepID=A0AAE0A1W6_9ROSI|nr:hypothetical protein Dsin_022410 [Dipteronia sinensis]